MIYLDNAATSFPKPRCVIEELYRCVCEYCGNSGRSSHAMSRFTSERIYDAREAIARHFSTDAPESVIFTYNATYALNIAIKAFITDKCHVITSDIEHNAVIRPLEAMSRKLGVSYSMFDTDGDVREEIISKIRPDTRGIISTLASNVTGKRIPLSVLCEVADRYKLFLIVDASQCAGHEVICLRENMPDALCAPGHKGLFGIQGAGFSIFKSRERMNTIIEGGSGSMSESADMPLILPDGYEAGTISAPAIVTLLRGIEYIDSIGVDTVEMKIKSLTERLKMRLLSIRDCSIYSEGNGIVSFNIGNHPSHRIADMLDSRGVCTRSGLHCAPSAHRKLGTVNQGTVRASLSYFNTEKEIDAFYTLLKEIRDLL